MNPPLISIVVPTLNQARFIEQTLASIAGLGWPRLELLVINGGSTDGTREIVERYAHVVTHFISEPDRGQGDAINKGMRLARGDKPPHPPTPIPALTIPGAAGAEAISC